MIRSATPADVPSILRLIKQLAEYEREPDAVKTDTQQLHDALFGPAPQVFAHVAVHDGQTVGCAVWFVNFSTWTGRHGIYLEDLIVDNAHRNNGYGRQLVAELARICVARGYGRLEWSVLDWNEPALQFYRSIVAEPMSEWTVHRVSGPALEALAQD